MKESLFEVYTAHQCTNFKVFSFTCSEAKNLHLVTRHYDTPFRDGLSSIYAGT